MGCRLWGHTELDTTEATEQQQIMCCLEAYILSLNFYIYMCYAVLSHRSFVGGLLYTLVTVRDNNLTD